jgi:hypothetical protein
VKGDQRFPGNRQAHFDQRYSSARLLSPEKNYKILKFDSGCFGAENAGVN